MKTPLLACIMLLLACNPAKKAARYNEDVTKAVTRYIQSNPCANDTIVTIRSDTTTFTEYERDTLLIDSIRTITQTKKIYQHIRDTIENTVVDTRLANFIEMHLIA